MSVQNDFSIAVATVNGTGSQSANNILLKSLFRMGVPVGGKNVFPSNIAGLPTWFWIRANQMGFVSQPKHANVVVNLNPSTINQDLKSLGEGGFFLYGEETTLSPEQVPAGVKAVPIPFKKLSEQATSSLKTRKLVVNMVYVGLLTELLRLDQDIVRKCIKDQLGSKESVLESNMKAFELGLTHAQNELKHLNFPFQAKAGAPPVGKIVIDGNSAAALGLIDGGCTFVSWYPITPSTSLVEAFSKFAPKLRKDDANGGHKFALVQSEDELAAIAMVLGAGWAGARALTATSGPGVSLMGEAAGYAYYTEIPAVIWDVQRTGPSTGMPTRTQQADILTAHFLSHGDTRHPLLIPGTVQECFEFGQTCFDLAEGLQTMVLVMSDLDLGMNLWISDEFKVGTKPYNRGKVLSKEDLEAGRVFERYRDVDGDGIPYRTLPGNTHPKAAYFTRGSGHTEKATYTENSAEYAIVVDRLTKKFETAKTLVPKPIIKNEGKKAGLIYFGSTEAAMNEAIYLLKQKQIEVDRCRLRALPFTAEVEKFIADHQVIYVVEQNRDAQMMKILTLDFPQFAQKFKSIRHYTGTPIAAEDIAGQLLQQEVR